jgi:hypothetical protein
MPGEFNPKRFLIKSDTIFYNGRITMVMGGWGNIDIQIFEDN